MFDIGNEIESIKHRDKRAALDREFPGEGCGNTECENLCAEALQIAKAMRLDPKTMIEDSIKQGIAPQTHCVPVSAEFTPPFFTAPCRFGFVCPNDHLALSESSKDSSFYVFHAKPGSCEKCQACDGITVPADKMQDESYMRSLGFWKQKDGVFRPHPNCKCKWMPCFARDLKYLALQEKQKIIRITREEDTRQRHNTYPVADACGTQAEELASRLYRLNLVCWHPVVVRGSKLLPGVRQIANLARFQSQHHAVAVISRIDALSSFVMDTYFHEISGFLSLTAWIAKYSSDPFFFKFMDSNAEIVDRINNEKTGEKIKRKN